MGSAALMQPTSGLPHQTGNNGALLLDNNALNPLWLLYNWCSAGIVCTMKHTLIFCLLALTIALGSPAQAADCYADYKAKQDNPLRLHYGVAELRGDCSRRSAQGELQGRLARAGWTLLNVVSVFGPEGLDQRKDSAGPYFLRF